MCRGPLSSGNTCNTAENQPNLQGTPSKQPPAFKGPAADVGELEAIMQNMAIRQDFVLAGELSLGDSS